jgi:hypothetical protein
MVDRSSWSKTLEAQEDPQSSFAKPQIARASSNAYDPMTKDADCQAEQIDNVDYSITTRSCLVRVPEHVLRAPNQRSTLLWS